VKPSERNLGRDGDFPPPAEHANVTKIVAKLSNFLAKSPAPRPREIECGLAVDSERQGALRLLLSAGGRLADDAQVEQFLGFTGQRHIDIARLWVAREAGKIVWTSLPIVSPGRTALLFTPADRWDGQAAGELVEAVSSWASGLGIHLLQLLLDLQLAAAREVFAQRQFRFIAELRYLQAHVRAREPFPQLPTGLAWELYSPASHDRFAKAITATYEESLDCPGLAGLRSIEDIVAGHKAGGEFDARYWYLLRHNARPAAVVLLNRLSGGNAAELTYLGVTPEARRQGIGRLLVLQALAGAAAMGAQTVTLAVDAANVPALRMYHRHGFRQVSSKIALMRDLRAC
jgi:ribosomal protein S18 acetylase RimI-like enzyme